VDVSGALINKEAKMDHRTYHRTYANFNDQRRAAIDLLNATIIDARALLDMLPNIKGLRGPPDIPGKWFDEHEWFRGIQDAQRLIGNATRRVSGDALT
jgi:hypothetical protein